MSDEKLNDILSDLLFNRCTKYHKPIDKDDTHIAIHKYGEEFLFCEDCADAALDCMKWYGEITKPLDYKINDSIFTDPALSYIDLEFNDVELPRVSIRPKTQDEILAEYKQKLNEYKENNMGKLKPNPNNFEIIKKWNYKIYNENKHGLFRIIEEAVDSMISSVGE